MLGAPVADFAGLVGDILLTQEFHGGTSGLFALSRNGLSFVTVQIFVGVGSAAVGQWEHVTFSSAGIVEIPPTTDRDPIPEPATIVLVGVGAVAALRRRRKTA